jgi:hypothetical protein
VSARDIRHGRRGGGWVADPASKAPPACQTCGQPMLRSKHGFGLCPDLINLGAGPEIMHLTVDGWHDGPVRVVSRTRRMVQVVTEAGSRLTVEAHLLTRLDRTAAA